MSKKAKSSAAASAPGTPESVSVPAAAPAAVASTTHPRPVILQPAGDALEPQSPQEVDNILATQFGLHGDAVRETPADNDGDDADEAPATDVDLEENPTTPTETPIDPDAEPPAHEPAAAANTIDDADLTQLASMSDEELTAHAQAEQWHPDYTKRVKKFTHQMREAQRTAEAAETLRQENEALKQRLEGKGKPAAEAGTPGEPPAPPETDALTKARAEVDLQGRTVTFAREHYRALTDVDTAPEEALAALNAELTERKLPVFADPRQARAWLKRVEDNAAVKREEARDRLLEARADARDSERQAVSEQRRQQAAMAGQAVAAYPWLQDPKSAEWKKADALVKANPELKQVPNWPLLVGQLVTGKAPAVNGNGNGTNGHANGHARQPLNGANGNGNGKPKLPTRPPGRPMAAPFPASRTERNSAEVSRGVMNGDVDSVNQALLAHLR